ncbi:GntR family transcriptional regulator [Cellulomonas endophytica]|uniref:GntR family transcriptional regulator n=1 Tax=Cellulomonas endophytica TaxID=2494735 RepID=UPI001010DBC8|nr:GntR family transcriptional regulator [Cellulomonas endophytica]
MPAAAVPTPRRRSVYEAIRGRILRLELAPGALLSENELAAELGVSRTPVRESLILLVQEGLVQVFPKIGTVVARVDPRRVADAQFLREAVELAALADVPADPDPAAVAALRENLVRQREAEGDLEGFFRLDEEFHQGLLHLSGHGGTWAPVAAAKGHLDRARRLGLHEVSPPGVFIGQHEAVLDAVLAPGAHDEACRLLRSHLRAVIDDIERVRRQRPDLFAAEEPGAPVRRAVAVWR